MPTQLQQPRTVMVLDNQGIFTEEALPGIDRVIQTVRAAELFPSLDEETVKKIDLLRQNGAEPHVILTALAKSEDCKGSFFDKANPEGYKYYVTTLQALKDADLDNTSAVHKAAEAARQKPTAAKITPPFVQRVA